MLYVRLFGCVQLWRQDRPVDKDLTRIPLLLFTYLLLERQRTHSRDALAGLFWGEYSQERARNCLNTALWRIRRSLERENPPEDVYIINGSHGEIGFNEESQYWLDVKEFEFAIHQAAAFPSEGMPPAVAARLEEALKLYHGDLLEGCYADWALQEREVLRSLYLDGLAHLMAFFRSQGNLEHSIECGQKILGMEPLREEIHREMMQLYWFQGKRVQALSQFDACRKLLMDELGISPMEETLALYLQISSQSSPGEQGEISGLPAIQSKDRLLLKAARELEETRRALENGQEKLRRLEETIVELSMGDKTDH